MSLSYRDSVPLSKRIEDSVRIVSKYPDHVPIIVESNDDILMEALKKKKYLVPKESTARELLTIIRTKLNLGKEKAVIMFVGNNMVCGSELIGFLYDNYCLKHKICRNNDNFFYMTLCLENTFG